MPFVHLQTSSSSLSEGKQTLTHMLMLILRARFQSGEIRMRWTGTVCGIHPLVCASCCEMRNAAASEEPAFPQITFTHDLLQQPAARAFICFLCGSHINREYMMQMHTHYFCTSTFPTYPCPGKRFHTRVKADRNKQRENGSSPITDRRRRAGSSWQRRRSRWRCSDAGCSSLTCWSRL